MKTITEIVEGFDSHISQSVLSMDKFERASVLNKLRTELTTLLSSLREGMAIELPENHGALMMREKCIELIDSVMK